jgi:NlpC/P60 family
VDRPATAELLAQQTTQRQTLDSHKREIEGKLGHLYDLRRAAWRAAGRSLPHNAAMQCNALPHISRASLSPGDLVFYSRLGHVGIHVGNGQIIHAPHAGDHVRLASVDVMPPYGYARP